MAFRLVTHNTWAQLPYIAVLKSATVCSSIRTFFRGSKLLTVAVLWTLFITAIYGRCFQVLKNEYLKLGYVQRACLLSCFPAYQVTFACMRTCFLKYLPRSPNCPVRKYSRPPKVISKCPTTHSSHPLVFLTNYTWSISDLQYTWQKDKNPFYNANIHFLFKWKRPKHTVLALFNSSILF